MDFIGSSIPCRGTFTNEQYREGKLYDLEDTKFVGSTDAEFYFSDVYGDYMILSQKDKGDHM